MATIKMDDLDQHLTVSEQEAALVNGGTRARRTEGDDYSGIVFSGGWGMAQYQYGFPGDYY